LHRIRAALDLLWRTAVEGRNVRVVLTITSMRREMTSTPINGTRTVFLDLGVVIVETASPSSLCEEVSRRLAGVPTPARQPCGNRKLRHFGAAIWRQ
jgi:hypothetical protein